MGSVPVKRALTTGMMDTPVSLWTIVSVLCLVCAMYLPTAISTRTGAANHEVKWQYPLNFCPYPESPDVEQHELFINKLDGKNFVFIGDSITRCDCAGFRKPATQQQVNLGSFCSLEAIISL